MNSNYAGVNSLFINPSFNVDSKIFIDVHIIGANAFLHNNVLYMNSSSSFLRPTTLVVDETGEKKKAYANFEVIGPSIAVSWKQHSFAVFTRLRTFLDAEMTKALFVLSVSNFDHSAYAGNSFNEKAYLNTITWFETGISYGYMHKRSSDETIDFGINIKRLTGINSTGLTMSDFDFIYNKKQDITINQADGDYRFVQPAWGVGKGWGVDLGVNYQKKLESVNGYEPNTKEGGCKHIDYKYKVGLSILDLGAFNVSNNAVLEQVSYTSQPFKFDSSKVKSVSDADKLLTTNLKNNNVSQSRSTSYRAWLPFGISLQYDYNFENNFYINATTITSFKITDQVQRVNVIAVTPRYERKYFEVDAPISLVDYTYPQFGLAFRFGNNLIIGSNRLDSWFGHGRNIYGGDIYFNLKFAIYRHCGGPRYKKKKAHTCDAY